MDDQGEDCIAVGSTGTLLSLMGKEMEIMQARRSCSVSYDPMSYKKSPSAKDHPNTLHASCTSSILHGSPAISPPSTATSIVSSLWSDLKGLLRSPTSIHHSPLLYHHNAHSPLLSHTNALFCKEHLDLNEDFDALCFKSPPLSSHSHPSPLKSPQKTHPKKGLAPSQAPASCPSSKETLPKQESAAASHPCPTQKPSLKETYPKEKVIPYSNQKSSLDDGLSKKTADYPHDFSKERSAAGAAANRKSPSHYRSQGRSDISYSNRKDTDVYRVTPTEIDQETRKGNRPVKERSLAGFPTYSKGKTMDAANPNLECPSYPKGLLKAMDAMRRSTASESHSQNSKVLQELEAKEGARTSCKNSCSRERAIMRRNMQDGTYCMQNREERTHKESVYSMQRREENVSMQDYHECCMQPMLDDSKKGPCTPASSPLHMTPCFKSSRSFGGRALPLVSVVDLQCCHTPTPRERSSRRLSFTRLLSF